MPDRYAPGGEAAEDLVAVLLAQQGHGDHQGPAELGEHRGRGVDHEASPDREVLEVADLGEVLGREQLVVLRR